MFNVVVERWGQILFTVFIFHVKSVFLFFQLLLGVKDIFLPYLAFFSVKKVTENFHCNKHFFSLQLSLRYYYLAGAELGSGRPGWLVPGHLLVHEGIKTNFFVYCCRAMTLVRQ